jgi:hypothetical protein
MPPPRKTSRFADLAIRRAGLRSARGAKGATYQLFITRFEVPMIADIVIRRAATELIERYGDSATAVAQERVKALSSGQDQLEMNIAFRVLSALESLLESKESDNRN